ncbi:Tripartite tricarboxylate transporter family receptor [compost metagenome]
MPYKGTVPAVNDVAAGNVDYTLAEFNAVLPLARAAQVRIVAVAGGQRLKDMPDVPTVAESGAPGLEADAWVASGPG